MVKGKCCICGTVKNCGPYLVKVLKNIDKIGALFDEYVTIFAYDKSSDNSLEILENYKNTNLNLIIMEEFFENFYGILEDTEKNEINKNTDYKSLDEWDSMTSLMLIAMVDEKYGKQIIGQDIKECLTLENLYARIQSK